MSPSVHSWVSAALRRWGDVSRVDAGPRDANDPIPVPPVEMRQLVGPTTEDAFDNPTGTPVFKYLEPAHYESVLDFGCGCGRLARQLIQQRPRPGRYAGIDLHPGMIAWCQENLAPHAADFSFHHHDVFYDAFNPGPGKPLWKPFPFDDDEFTLVVAVSVFTHLTQDQSAEYLGEVARVLRPGGMFLSTWFLFDKRDFPMMQTDQDTLFINAFDVRNAVIYDRAWLTENAAASGLAICSVSPPEVRGYHWTIGMTQDRPGVDAIEIPDDVRSRGRRPPPAMPSAADRIGL